MKKTLMAVIIGLSVIACPILYFLVGPSFTSKQLDILAVLLIVMGISGLYCFLIGEITRNYSQMDKLWSILPAIYTWIIAIMGEMDLRLIIMASLATIWGIRLTFNFARKGAYHIKFWTGKEDYRWIVLRSKKEFQPHWKWMIFNLLFISIYQNLLVLMICFPALISVGADNAIGWIDYLAMSFVLFFIIYETIADEQQWKFQTKKWQMINEGKKLEELPNPYNKGFNTTGLWKISRHPNYFSEQAIWFCFYFFSVGAGIFVFNWSIIGSLLLFVLFAGSAAFAEEISKSKYPQYNDYIAKVFKFFPGKKYQD